jgi:hypothetical protein
MDLDVDYSVMFDCLDIVLTEAKKENVEDGILQNVMQQRAAQEYVSNILVGDKYGLERKRKFEEVFQDIASVPSYGIISTGATWVLTKVTYFETTKQSELSISDPIEVSLDSNEDNLKSLLTKLIQKLTHIIVSQVNHILNNENFQSRRKIDSSPFDNIVLAELSEAIELEKEDSQNQDGGDDKGDSDDILYHDD